MSSTESIEVTRVRRDVESISLRSFTPSTVDITPQFVTEDIQNDNGNEDSEEYYPDGGWKAYSVVLGSFLGSIVNLGIINSIGAVQAYVSTHQLAMVSASSISWIFSIYLALAYALGMVAGPIFDRRGPLELLVASTVFIFLGLMASANSTKVYHFILSFIALGIGNGIGMNPLIGVISHWFCKKRGNCTGIATSGGSVGGLFFPLMLRHTYTKYGYVWAMRIFAFTCLGCMVLSIVLVRGRFTKKSSYGTSSGDLDSVEVERTKWNKISRKLNLDRLFTRENSKYLFLIGGAFFGELSLVLLITYFATYAMAQGVSESTSLLLLTVWNGTGILGRLIPGYLSDIYGHFNINIIMLSTYTVTIFVMWLPFGDSQKVLFAFAAIGGYCSGSILSLLPACLSQITKVNEIGIKYGILNTVLSTGNLFGIPLASVVISSGTIQHYNNFVVFVGCLAVTGTALWYMSRFMIVGRRLNVKV
ncbi:monocarboxylate permease [Scheffersomyces xylosifermentans]|uniref:monocarboxylate permease n=1 Tax=Scheffersomyces xylosifermentans TaxID=1304137 RepID=UPI00315CBF66